MSSCMDFNFFNTSPLKPSLTDSQFHKEQNKMKQINDNIDKGGWNFLQFLSNPSEINNKEEEEEEEEAIHENQKVYVHPLQNHSSSSSSYFSSTKLSNKSLEMCTESLGNETGTNFSDEIHFTSSLDKLESSQQKYYTNYVTEKRRTKRRYNFPPPLTSINGVQLRPYREEGRLVLKAENVSSCLNYFQADRSEGRLRLCFLQNYCSHYNYNPNDDEEEDEEEDDDETETETEETEETEEEELNGNVKVRGEMGVKKVSSMTSRCKEGEHGRSKGLLNLEPFWVAS